MAKKVPALQDALEERAGILAADGLPSNPLHTAFAHMGRGFEDEILSAAS
jgi:hypothetical protein